MIKSYQDCLRASASSAMFSALLNPMVVRPLNYKLGEGLEPRQVMCPGSVATSVKREGQCNGP